MSNELARAGNGPDCRHEGIECEVVFECNANCPCQDCRTAVGAADDLHSRAYFERRAKIQIVLDQWRNDHAFMFVKDADDESWKQLIQDVRNA